MLKIEFRDEGDFAAYEKACKWCKDNGVSYGSMQRDEPIGLMYGDVSIAKWLNLSKSEQNELHGTMTGQKRVGPVFISIQEKVK
jgi:hypothetical protein